MIKKFGAHNQLAVEHLEIYFSRDLSQLSHLLPIESYIDRPRPIKEEIELLKKVHKAITDKSYNRLANSHIGTKPEDYSLKSQIIKEGRTFTSPMRDLNKRKHEHDDPWIHAATSEAWPSLISRPMSALVHLNKKSAKKTQFIEDYPRHPAYIDSPSISSRGLIGDGYQVSRPIQIESKRFEALNVAHFDPDSDPEQSARQIDAQVQKNSTHVWMDEYSSLGRMNKEAEEEIKRVNSQVSLKSSNHIEKIKEISRTLKDLADQEEIIEQSQATFHKGGASMGNLRPSSERKIEDVFSTGTRHGIKSLAHISEQARESTTEKLQSGSKVSMKITQNTVKFEDEKELPRQAKTTGALPSSCIRTPITKKDYSEEPAQTFSGLCYDILNLKRYSEQAAGEMVITMHSNLYNLYQVAKRRDDANFFTKRDLQALLHRLNISCTVLVSDTLYELLDFGKDGVVCFTDFERALLPRDPNVLNVARRANSRNFKDLNEFETSTVELLKACLCHMVSLAQCINTLRKDFWRDINNLKKSSLANFKEIALTYQDKKISASSEEVDFMRKLVAAN